MQRGMVCHAAGRELPKSRPAHSKGSEAALEQPGSEAALEQAVKLH